MTAIPLTEAKAHLSQIVERIEREHDRVTVTRNGRPAAVLISVAELEGMDESIDILSDADLVASLRRSRRQAAEGDLTDLASLV